MARDGGARPGEIAGNGAPSLDNCVHYAHVRENRSANNSLSRQVPPLRRLDRLPPKIPSVSLGDVLSTSNTKEFVGGGSAASKGGANTTSSGSSSFVCRTEHISSSIYQGVSRAEWPKDSQYASIQAGGVICCPPEAVDIECGPCRAEGFSKSAKKL